MRPKEIKKLIEFVEKSNINELEVTRWGKKVRIVKSSRSQATVAAPAEAMAVPSIVTVPTPPPVVPVSAGPESPQPLPEAKPTAANLIEVRSPMVGTFYRAPAPDADPYVQVGDIVAPNQVLCIIEAMKLMNEIECEVRGRVAEILVENAQPVEYNQILFRIEKL
ncbi:MAG: acetyl-CoA carboxylase biotin carboxyl carrier protein [candidate division KSB1 bacterium]|nr:acetyl-CoA carboxylase biotin carboxyl carrier protein [candidate division KSB1 bacterium]MDZ7318992.1 acetyl-CoA carboxylase biotin carboxyl carrier protein [candidate division KSB1 bacterium]MDZ7339922.1 acetyl-CoA carboxylase biotin carboxyl carrier protein [candidate division KSB1 bacterium]